MKNALQAILIAPDPAARLAIMLGKKSVTIREGHRDYKPGPVVICCHLDPWAIMATITEVKHTTLAEVAPAYYWADGYEDRKSMLKDLQQYYPSMTMKSQVTIIIWDHLEGFYTDVDNVQKYAEDHNLDMEYE